MATFDMYSKRNKGAPDVWVYNKITNKLKVQIFHIWNDFFNQDCFTDEYTRSIWFEIDFILRREEGKKQLSFGLASLYQTQVENYYDSLTDDEAIINVIDIVFRYIIETEKRVIKYEPYIKIRYTSNQTIEDLNTRFRENGFGFQFINSKIIRIDSLLLHNEIILPVLNLLNEKDYLNVNEEFLNAHEHYRFRRNKECLADCLKSFESTIKIICQKNNWEYKPGDTAKPLINILISKNFFSSYHESHLNALRLFLESSIPTIRNKTAGHGQGSNKIVVPDSLASYMLNITGSTIRLLVETQITY
ncbi:hypothetical protein BH23BAC2_BH23BAC2_03420 [soil metagenome]